MPKPKKIRFAAGTPGAPFSSVWRIIVVNNDVYLGAPKALMQLMKISLHKSGVWVLAATQESHETFDNGNRRLKRWLRPIEHTPGITKGPSIFVPHTSLGSRPLSPDETFHNVIWYDGPQAGETVHFSLYFVKPNAVTNWSPEDTILAECPLTDGGHVILHASKIKIPAELYASYERDIRENVLTMSDPTKFAGGSMVRYMESTDQFKVMIMVDLPLLVVPE